MRHDLINLMRQKPKTLKISEIDRAILDRAVAKIKTKPRGFKDCAIMDIAEELSVSFNSLKNYVRVNSGAQQ